MPAAGPADRVRSACFAPHTTIYFDQFGKAKACCQTLGSHLGDVTRQTLREIWSGAAADQVRRALEADRYDAGCDFCGWQLREGNTSILYARKYDRLRPAERRPTWPRRMEFALTNACNLQCQMCNGNWSSSIRAKREGRPPMASAYGDAFFEQLAEFLPHLEEVEFLGGEPFLGAEPLRVMEMLAELDRPPTVTVTTNGTILTDRVRRLVGQLRPNIVVSLDGATPATFERIRVGARLSEVLANLDWFCDALGDRSVSLAHCLMTSNWHEFADLLELAERRNLFVGINVVRFPAEHSLYQLTADELRPVVAFLRSQAVELTASRLDAWTDQVGALANRLQALEAAGDAGPQGGMGGGVAMFDFATDEPRPNLSRWAWLPFPEQGTAGMDPVALVDASAVEVGTDGVLHHVAPVGRAPIDLSGLDGRPFEELTDALTVAYGMPTTWTGPPRRGRLGRERVELRLTPKEEGAPPVRLVVSALRDEAGALIGARFAVASSDAAPSSAGQRVEISPPRSRGLE